MSKSKDGAAVGQVLDYLTTQNRPYSVNDIVNNLHKEHGKTSVTRALEQLVEEKKIVEKTYGKQKIYFADQSHFSNLDDDTLKKMDVEIDELTSMKQKLDQSVKALEAENHSINSSLTTSEARTKLAQLEKEVSAHEAKLADLKSNTKQVSLEDKKAIVDKHGKCVKAWRMRKRMVTDMTEAILEGYPKPKKVFLEEVGIETDEAAKVALPQ